MALTNTGLVNFAKKKMGVNYVYGMKGKVMTLEMYKSLKRTYPDIVRDTDVKKVGTLCTDCSGLISWYTGKIKSSQMYHDEAERNGLLRTIASIGDAPIGSAVWYKGHIGIYIGNGRVIEARGAAYGVVESDVKARKFTHWFELSDITYKKDYYPKYTGTSSSIVSALKEVGVKDTTLSHRKRIGVANGIAETESGYIGSAEQNTAMLNLLKKGKLVKSE